MNKFSHHFHKDVVTIGTTRVHHFHAWLVLVFVTFLSGSLIGTQFISVKSLEAGEELVQIQVTELSINEVKVNGVVTFSLASSRPILVYDTDIDVYSSTGPTGDYLLRTYDISKNLLNTYNLYSDLFVFSDTIRGVKRTIQTTSGLIIAYVPLDSRIATVAVDNRGVITNIISPVPPPAAPSNLVASSTAYNQIRLMWTDNSINESGFKIERKVGTSTLWSPLGTTGAGAIMYFDNTVSAGTLYSYRIKAYNSGSESSYSNISSATTPTISPPPSTPTNLNAIPVSPSKINLTWTDTSTNEEKFRLERASVSSGPWTEIAALIANQTGYSNINLSASTTYYYRLRASNTGGYSPYSNTVSTTTLKGDTTAPSVPGVTITPLSTSQIKVVWKSSIDNTGGSGVAGYKVRRRIPPSLTSSIVYTASASTLSYTNSGLITKTTYCYRVEVSDVAGNVALSPEMCAKTF